MDDLARIEALHIKPTDDLLAHEWESCPCLPHLVYEDGAIMYVHNAWDGRD